MTAAPGSRPRPRHAAPGPTLPVPEPVRRRPTSAVGLLLLLALAVLAALTWAGEELYDQVTEGDGFGPVDHPALDLALSVRGPVLTALAQALAWSGGTTGAVVVGSVLLTLLTRHRRDGLPATVLVAGMAGSLALTTVGKAHVGRVRPPVELALRPIAHSPAFPSGHTLNATVLMGLTVYLVALSPRLRVGGSHRRAVGLAAVAAALYALVMGASRVYLAAHWLTDVMAGWTVGLAWTLCVLLAHRAWLALRSRRADARGAAEGAR